MLNNPELMQARLAAIIATSDDAIVSKNLDGIVQSWNAAAERIFGYKPEEIVGKSIIMILPPERLDEETQILARLRRGERVDHFETIRVRKDGTRIDVSVTISPIKDSTGRVVGASKIARDITSLKRYDREREQLLAREQEARKEAERANRMKDEFMATLSHELRTPLNAILGWAQLLRGASNMPAHDLAEGLEVIERNARVQTQLVEELLDMSRIVSGKLRLDIHRLDLVSIVSDAMESVRPAANGKQIDLQTKIDPNLGPVNGDARRMQQIIWNLLSNAIKFTPGGGRVQLILRREQSQVQIIVSDNGIGINEEFMPHLFARFTQADGSSGRKHGGLGLGLAIVRHLVELHGGTVTAHSAGQGKGATVTVSLPLAASESAAGGPDDQDEQSARAASSELLGVSVLVVDDEPDARALLKRVLHAHGATVYTASSAAEGYLALREHRPNVLLSDIAMPDEDGYQLLANIRALSAEEGGETPAVALTAYAGPEDRRKAMVAGFQLHLPKPVETAELLAVVANLSGAHRRRLHAMQR